MNRHSLYVGTSGNATGKRMVALGVMELASRRFDRVAFYRPVVRVAPDQDQSIRMMRARYGLPHTPESMMGVTRTEARRLLAADKYSQLIQRIQERFKSLESVADFVVVEGTSYQGLAPELEFELNADLAVNLGCRILAVYAMGDRSVEDCIQSVRIGNDSFADHGGSLVATVINQVRDADAPLLYDASQEANLDSKAPVYFLPEEPLLRQPTIREIQAGLSAKLFSGDDASLDREVSRRKVAAMQLPGFLERLSNASLVMTPGDRSDIIVGCLLASSRHDVPSPAGVVLTGGILPPPPVRELIKNCATLPILTVTEDTYTAAAKAAEVRAEIGEHSPRKVESAIGLFERYIDTEALASRLRAPAPQRITPMLFEHSLIERARQQRVKIVLPESTEPRVLQAVDVLSRRDVADLVLLGDENKIASAAAAAAITLPDHGLEIIDPHESPLADSFAEAYYRLRMHRGVTLDVARDRMLDVTYFGTMMVHQGLAGGLVSGAIHTTANTIR
ncbi:MAG: phosphate acetyltransferase, partial [Planctomycetota bacterium]